VVIPKGSDVRGEDALDFHLGDGSEIVVWGLGCEKNIGGFLGSYLDDAKES